MSVIFVLILISGLIATAFLIVFIWSVRSGQYDDTYSPSVRMLFQDNKPSGKKKNSDLTDEKDSSTEGRNESRK